MLSSFKMFSARSLLPGILIGITLCLLAQPDAHADGWRGGWHDGWRGGWRDGWHDGWHGDIRFAHGWDLDRWRGGRWFHGWHDGRFTWWWTVGGLWYPYAVPVYPYPDPYSPPEVVVQQAPVVVAPAGPPVAATAPHYWYYCRKPAGYYPYVPQCKGAWEPVPATSP